MCIRDSSLSLSLSLTPHLDVVATGRSSRPPPALLYVLLFSPVYIGPTVIIFTSPDSPSSVLFDTCVTSRLRLFSSPILPSFFFSFVPWTDTPRTFPVLPLVQSHPRLAYRTSVTQPSARPLRSLPVPSRTSPPSSEPVCSVWQCCVTKIP